MSQVFCKQCSKPFERVRQNINYCPTCADSKPVHTRICTICKQEFYTRQVKTFRCLACQRAQYKASKENEAKKKSKPILMTDEEQYRINMGRYKDWVKPVAIESMKKEDNKRFLELKEEIERRENVAKCVKPGCATRAEVGGHCNRHAREDEALSALVDQKNAIKKERRAMRNLAQTEPQAVVDISPVEPEKLSLPVDEAGKYPIDTGTLNIRNLITETFEVKMNQFLSNTATENNRTVFDLTMKMLNAIEGLPV